MATGGSGKAPVFMKLVLLLFFSTMWGTASAELVLRIWNKSNSSFSLGYNSNGNAMMVPRKDSDARQRWIQKLDDDSRDTQDEPIFALVNQATQRPLSHRGGKYKPVSLRAQAFKGISYDDIKWSRNYNVSGSFDVLRSALDLSAVVCLAGELAATPYVVVWDWNGSNGELWQFDILAQED